MCVAPEKGGGGTGREGGGVSGQFGQAVVMKVICAGDVLVSGRGWRGQQSRRQCTPSHPPTCPRTTRAHARTPMPGSLFANVATPPFDPSQPQPNWPVLIYFHAGEFFVGAGNDWVRAW